jgi:hypothetical protein
LRGAGSRRIRSPAEGNRGGFFYSRLSLRECMTDAAQKQNGDPLAWIAVRPPQDLASLIAPTT